MIDLNLFDPNEYGYFLLCDININDDLLVYYILLLSLLSLLLL
jgi:hypothetical protein